MVGSANDPKAPFPLNSLPCGVFSTESLSARCGVATGDAILDCKTAEEAGMIRLGGPLLAAPSWNAVMAAGPEVWARLRARLTEILAD